MAQQLLRRLLPPPDAPGRDTAGNSRPAPRAHRGRVCFGEDFHHQHPASFHVGPAPDGGDGPPPRPYGAGATPRSDADGPLGRRRHGPAHVPEAHRRGADRVVEHAPGPQQRVRGRVIPPGVEGFRVDRGPGLLCPRQRHAGSGGHSGVPGQGGCRSTGRPSTTTAASAPTTTGKRTA